MNIKEIDQTIFTYLIYIFRDFSILLFQKQLKEPYFQSSHAVSDKTNWPHSFNAGNRLCVRVQIDKLDEENILFNMLHLVIHAYNRENGKIDMSRSANGRYHRAEFGREAHRVGITCKRDSNYGYQIVGVNETLKEECMNIIDRYYQSISDLLHLHFTIEDIRKNENSNNVNYVKYWCPVCHRTIKAVNGAYVICGICNAKFERV